MEHSPVPVPANSGSADTSELQARHLRRLLEELSTQLDRVAAGQTTNCYVNSSLEKRVRGVIRSRRAREKFFEPTLFADPAWDMLLELFACDLAGRRMSVTSLCAGAAVPATTALRWIRALEEHGLVVRKDDPLDRRRSFLSLSSTGFSAMITFFETDVAII